MEVQPPLSEREERWRGYVSRIARGESEALTSLYDECASTLLGLALRLLKNKSDAEEIILDVFQQVWRTAGSFDANRGSVWRWLTLLMRSRALDRLRTATARRERDHLSIQDDMDVASPAQWPDHATIFNQESARIRAAMQGLTADQRQALELAYYSGLTHVEIASALGAPLGTVKSRIRSAMEKLRISLTEDTLAASESAR